MKNKTSKVKKTPYLAIPSVDIAVTVMTINSPESKIQNLNKILNLIQYSENLSFIVNHPLSEKEIAQLDPSLSKHYNFKQLVGEEVILPKMIYFPRGDNNLYVTGNIPNKIKSVPILKLINTPVLEVEEKNEWSLIQSKIFSDHSKKRKDKNLGEVIGVAADLDNGDQRKNLENLLGYATRLAKIGSWEVDIGRKTTYISPVGLEILEKNDQIPLSMPRDLTVFKSGNDRKIIREAAETAIKSGKSFDAELRLVTDSGKEKWVRIIGDTDTSVKNNRRIFGSIQDIDNLKQVQIKLAIKSKLMAALTDIEGILLEADAIEQRIQRCFQKIGELLSVDRVYYFEYGLAPSNSEEVISQRIEWTAKGVSSHIGDPEMKNVPVALLGNLITQLKNRETHLLEVNSISNSFLLDVFTDQNIKQAILAPILVNQTFFGFIGCDQCAKFRKWSHEENNFLERCVSRISAAIETHEANQKIWYKSKLIQTNSRVVELLFKNENWENAADKVFKLLGETVQADRTYYFECFNHPESKELFSRLKYEWTNEGIPSDLPNPDYQYLRLADHPEFLEKVLIGDPFSFLAKDLVGLTRNVLDQSNIKSILQIPVFKFGEFCGFVGFDDCSEERIWSSDEITFLKSITSNLGIAMERKEQVSQILNSNKEKRDILESIGDAFFTLDYDGKVTYWNKKANELLNLHQDGVPLEKYWYFFDIITDPIFLSKFHDTNRKKNTSTFETYYSKTGAWFEVNLYPSNNGVTAYLKDISEKKKANELINQSNERYEKLTEATNDAIYDWDMTTNTVFMGKGFKTLFGYDYLHEPYSFDIWQDRIHPNDRLQVNTLMEQIVTDTKSSGSYQIEYRYRMKNGEYTYVADRGMIIRNESGAPIRLIGATQDISYRKIYEESLKSLNLSLQERAKQLSISNSELEQFAFVVSHDLQEPLRMVTSFLTQLNRKYGDELDEKAQTYIHFAVDGAKRMREIILDLLEFSTVGKQEETKQDVNLNEIVHEVQYLLKRKIETSSTVFKINQLPTFRGYKNRLIQVMTSLIDNAIKYRNREVPLTVTVKAEKENDHWLISIRDNGIGIEEEYFENIFVIFKKLHPKDSFEGTGMGLALVKKIVENWGGKIWLESTLHFGSIFYFTIPINGK